MSMTEFAWRPYRLLVDVARTQAYYRTHPQMEVSCDCAGCRNFAKAMRRLSPAVLRFFETLGVDPGKPGECCHDPGTAEAVTTSAWYHLCGTIQEGDHPPGSYEAFAAWLPVTTGVRAAFKTACDLLPEEFPQPCFQMNVCYEAVPWLLEEPNPYIGE